MCKWREAKRATVKASSTVFKGKLKLKFKVKHLLNTKNEVTRKSVKGNA